MKKLVVLHLLLVIAITSNAQAWKRNRLEVFGGLPITHYFGDIGGAAGASNMMGLKDITVRSLGAGFSAGAVYRLNTKLYVQASGTFGVYGGSDRGSRNEARNYSFTTTGTEFAATAHFYIIPESDKNYFYSVMQLRGGLKHINKPLSLYLFAGAGGLVYKIKPHADLATSDRFDDSQTFSAIIPFGIGMKYQLFARTLLGVELGARYMLSDKIDGFSPTQSEHNDFYYAINFKVYYRLPYTRLFKR
ncbi:MAG: hypothetical protein H6536_00175 [Bacteroidales bacterium]|nr:hypothetical protein [Bacteroidales bacterium]